jgi:hypothetical protein
LTIFLPEAIRELNSKEDRKNSKLNLESLQMSIYGTVVPDISVPPQEVPFSGQTYNVTSYSRPNYPPLLVNFIVDNRFKNYYILWKWLSILSDPTQSMYAGTDPETWKDRVENGTLTEYQSNFSLLSKDEYNKTIIEFQYSNAFITGLGGISYDYNDATIIKSSMQFQFSQLNVIYKP